MSSGWLPAYQYQPTENGFWFPPTATIDWCEERYYATHYIAEVVNATTNILFLALGIKGVVGCLKYGHDRIFLVSYIGYLLVGTGSFLFHTTLKYPMQLVDELSMIYTTCLMCYACFSFAQSPRFCLFLAAGLSGLAIFITAYYHYLQDPEFHQRCYAILTAAVLFRSMYIMEVNLRPSFWAKNGTTSLENPSSEAVEAQRASDDRDRKIVNQMWFMVGFGLSIFLGGFAIWALDNKHCSTLRRWRHEIGLPWGVLLEGHGWWHLMTGTGAYFYLVWGTWLRHCLNGRKDEYVLKWPSIFFSLPEIVPAISTKHTKRNGNGTTMPNIYMNENGTKNLQGEFQAKKEQ